MKGDIAKLKDLKSLDLSISEFSMLFYNRCQCRNCISLKQGKVSKYCQKLNQLLELMGKEQKCITESLRFKNVCCDPDVIRHVGPIDDELLLN